MKTRIASNGDAKTIAKLHHDLAVEVDWSNIYPYWIVAELDHVVGCVQVNPGRPFGRLEMLKVDETLHHRKRAEAVMALAYAGMATLRADGSQYVMMVIPHELKNYKKVLKKRGAVTIGGGNILMRSLE